MESPIESQKSEAPLRFALSHLVDLRNLVGVEVGVDQGIHAYAILRDLDVSMLFLIDPYTHYSQSPGMKLERGYSRSHPHLWDYRNRVIRIYQPSGEAADLIPDGKLDFAYLDGDHSYEGLKIDLPAYWVKLRPGALFCGHDYDMSGVKRAVDEFAAESGRGFDVGPEGKDWLLWRN